MPDFTRPDIPSQLMGTTPDGRPGRIYSEYDGDVRVSLSDAGGHNIVASVFGDLITGTRHPVMSHAFNEGIPLEVFKPVLSGSATASIEKGDLGSGEIFTNMLMASTGATDSIAKIASLVLLRYRPSHESYLFFTAKFDGVDAPGTTALCGIFDDENGYALGFKDTSFVYRRLTGGSEHLVTAEDFNGRLDLSKFDFSKINIFAIRFGYLGAAPISLYIFDPEVELDIYGKITGFGKFKLLHQEKFTGAYSYPHSINPNLPFSIHTENGTSGTDVRASVASVEFGNVSGSPNSLDPSIRTGVFNRIGLSTGTNTLVGVFRNPESADMPSLVDAAGNITKSAFKNTIPALLRRIRISSDGALSVSVAIYLIDEADITGIPTWQQSGPYEGVVEHATNVTVDVSSAKLLSSFELGKVDRISEAIRDDQFLIRPGQLAAIVANGNNTINFFCSWEEQL